MIILINQVGIPGLGGPMSISASAALKKSIWSAVGVLAQAIRSDPDVAATTWAAEVHWTGGFQSEARVRGFAPLAFG